jgi:hypothetical protein
MTTFCLLCNVTIQLYVPMVSKSNLKIASNYGVNWGFRTILDKRCLFLICRASRAGVSNSNISEGRIPKKQCSAGRSLLEIASEVRKVQEKSKNELNLIKIYKLVGCQASRVFKIPDLELDTMMMPN